MDKSQSPFSLEQAIQTVASVVQQRRIGRTSPFLVSLDGGSGAGKVEKMPSEVLILDGIYSGLPEISDLIDLFILVDVSPELRRHRHNIREGTDDADWHLRWDSVEDYYFTALRPPDSYDVIVVNA